MNVNIVPLAMLVKYFDVLTKLIIINGGVQKSVYLIHICR